jgi:ABC-type amino acid transport substrate-binding protein
MKRVDQNPVDSADSLGGAEGSSVHGSSHPHERGSRVWLSAWVVGLVLLLGPILTSYSATAGGLREIQARGTLRHLGVPYANFVTGAGDGLDVELMQGFAEWLGVRYAYVKTDWSNAIGDLTGEKVVARDGGVERLGEVAIKGDVIANGMTVIPWREGAVRFGVPTFPTQVWLVSRAAAEVSPVTPAGSLADDIVMTKSLMRGKTLLGKLDTCLDPSLYGLERTGATIRLFDGKLTELAPALLNNEAEMTLLDVPDALVAMEKWPGQIKVIGPVSEVQQMAPAFRPNDVELHAAFNRYLREQTGSGAYTQLVRKYYPFVFEYFPDFFANL